MTDPHHILTLATLLGALGMWLMLPRGTARGTRRRAIVLAAIALGLGASQLPRLGDWMADGVFLVLAAVTVVSAAAAVTFRNPVYCAIWFGSRCWARPGCSCSPAPSFWPWPRWWSMPGRSWSRSCSCSCSPSRRARPPTTA